MHDPAVAARVGLTKEQYMSRDTEQQTTLNHFYEKVRGVQLPLPSIQASAATAACARCSC